MRTLYVVTGLLLVLALAGGGHILRERDTNRAHWALATANMRHLQLELALLKQTHATPPAYPPGLELATARIEVLRRVVWTLVERGVHWAGTVTMPSLHDANWPSLPTPGWDLKCEPMRVAGGEPR